MRLSKKITFGVVIITLLFVFAACTTSDSVKDTVDQAELEQEAKETISALNNDAGKGDITALESSLSEDFIYTTENGEEGNKESIDEYFQKDDLVYLKISEEGTVDRIVDNEMRIYTELIIGLEIGESDVIEFETDITITLKNIDGNWSITRWDEGHKDKSDQDDDDFDGDYKEEVNQRLRDISNFVKNGEIDNLVGLLAEDFEYEGPVLNDEDGDLEVEIEGLIELVILDSDVQTFLDMKYDAELEFEEDNGT